VYVFLKGSRRARAARYRAVVERLLGDPAVSEAQMMGMPSFDPSGRGRPMKDWALVNAAAADWLELAGEAKAFAARAEPAGPTAWPRGSC
jgi:hypothetical protein